MAATLSLPAVTADGRTSFTGHPRTPPVLDHPGARARAIAAIRYLGCSGRTRSNDSNKDRRLTGPEENLAYVAYRSLSVEHVFVAARDSVHAAAARIGEIE